MNKAIYPAIYLLIMFLLSSCANNVDCEVVSFHNKPLPKGETISIKPLNPSHFGSIQFKEYATLVSEQLRTIGYTPISKGENASLIAEIDYHIIANQSKVIETTEPFVLYHFNRGRFRYPYYYGYHGIMNPPYTREYVETVYNRELVINIVKAEGLETNSREVVFETLVTSTGRKNNLPEIMPYLVSAAFTNFPGESGVTKIITIEKNQ